MVATHPAVLPAPLYFRSLERARSIALRQGLSYDATVEVTGGMRLDLSWWITSLSQHNGRAVEITQWNLTIESDASKMGWGHLASLDHSRWTSLHHGQTIRSQPTAAGGQIQQHGSGCTINPMEEFNLYMFPPLSKQTEGGDGLSTTNRTSMAEPGLVPTVIEVIGGPSSPSTPYPGHTPKSSRAKSSSGRTDSLRSRNWQEERNPLFIAVRKPYTTQLNQQQ